MKILFISHEKNVYGSTKSMLTLAEELKKKFGVEVKILLPNSGKAEELLQQLDINYEIIRYFNNCRKIEKRKIVEEYLKDSVNFAAIRRIEKLIKKEKYDYIISNSTAVDVGARAAQKCRVHHCFFIREFMKEDFSLEYRNQKKMKFLLEQSEKIIFISKAIEEKYLSNYNINNYRTIYNGIKIEDYYLKNHTILATDTLNILQMGTISEGKGTKDSIKLIYQIKEKIKCRLTLMGNCEKNYLKSLYDYIKELSLEDYVNIVPYSVDVKSELAKTDILLMNSKAEGFGRVSVEGMLGGVLVIGRNTGGTREVIMNEINGILFDTQEELCEILGEVYRYKNKYCKIAKNGQKNALKRFSSYKNALRVYSYLEESE